MALISINGVAIPTPSEMKPSIMNISNSERNANGTMIMEIIAQKQKLELSWNVISAEDLSSLLNLIDATFFNVEYPNPKTNGRTVKTMYCGDRSVGVMSYVNEQIRYKDFKVNFIER